MAGVRTFQRRLVDHLQGQEFAAHGTPPAPHITLDDHRDPLGDTMIDPISWRVEEIVLIESVVGETRHVAHARWRFRPKPRLSS